MSNVALAYKGQLVDLTKLGAWCAEQLATVRNWLVVLLYTIQDQRIRVGAEFDIGGNITCTNSASLASMFTRSDM